METPPAVQGQAQQEDQAQATATPPPQNGPNTLIFQNTSSRLSIPLSLLRLSEANGPAEEGSVDTGATSSEVDSVNGVRARPLCKDELEAYCLESNVKKAESLLNQSKSHSTKLESSQQIEAPLEEAAAKAHNSGHYEALLHVLQLVPIEFRLAVVPLVCKEWRDAAFDPACWSRVDVGEVRFREGKLEAAREIFWDASPRQLQGLVKKAVEKSGGQMQSFCALVRTSETLSLLATGCPYLKTLLVPRSLRAVSNDTLAAVARSCRGLTELDVSGCLKLTEVGLIQVATFCKGLQRLNVAGNFQFSNWALASVALNCRGLKNLDVSGCLRVRDDGLQVLAAKCGGLVSLDLGWCRDVTDHGVCEIARSCVKLESIGLSSCKHLTDESVAAIAFGCSQLSVLNVSSVDNLTDKALLALAAYGAQLTDLNVGGCFRITDQAVSAIVGACPKLNRISLRGCTRLSDVSLRAVAGRQLYYLDVRGCKGMSEGLIQEVMQARNNQKRRLVSSYGL